MWQLLQLDRVWQLAQVSGAARAGHMIEAPVVRGMGRRREILGFRPLERVHPRVAAEDVMGPTDAAFTWQRSQLSREWQMAHWGAGRSFFGACVASQSGSLCDAGLGKAAIVAVERFVASPASCGRWRNPPSAARCSGA